jgi:tape measure domain-containing protein
MAANTGTIRLELVVDDKGSVALSNAALKGIFALDRLRVKSSMVARLMRSSFASVKSGIGGIIDKLMNWKTALASLVGFGGFGLLANQTINGASSFENMRLSLDTMTKGQGATTLNQLNEWALKMPVNTQKAVQSFIMMRAMGLDPTLAQMTTLVDTMSALGGNAETLEGIARALGQIQTKGKVSAEELMQLAERGVPVFEILRERFGEVDTSSLNAAQAIEAIFAGLDERFGGMSKKQQNA